MVTHADGAVGIQISQPIGRLVVKRGVETFGGTGDSLVKGVLMKLAAIALSVKPGGSAKAWRRSNCMARSGRCASAAGSPRRAGASTRSDAPRGGPGP